MKNLKIGAIISCVLVIAGAVMKIMHINYGSLIILAGTTGCFILLNMETKYWKKRAKELEKKND